MGAAFVGTFVSCFLDAGFVTLNHARGDWVLGALAHPSVRQCSRVIDPGAGDRQLEQRGLCRSAVAPQPRVSWRLRSSPPVSCWRQPWSSTVSRPASARHPSFRTFRFPLSSGQPSGPEPGEPAAFLLIITGWAIWGAVHGRGPFLTSSPAENALTIQLFMIVFSIPLLMLAAVMEERRDMEVRSRENEERLNLTLSAAQLGTWEWRIGRGRRPVVGKIQADPGPRPRSGCVPGSLPQRHRSGGSVPGADGNSWRAGGWQAIRV